MNFEQMYASLALEDMERFVDEGQQEHLRLDFKEVSNPNMNADDRKNFAKALSGFANSSGGLIVWGVEAKRDSEGIDVAQALKPIKPVKQFFSRLNQLTGEAVTPFVDGVDHRLIEMPNSDGGFVLTIVPESIGGPHMAKLRENRYYKRSGDSFYMMEHFDIADMFGRRPTSDLAVCIQAFHVHVRDEGRRVLFLLSVLNLGRRSARFPFVSVELPKDMSVDRYGLDGNTSHGFLQLPSNVVTERRREFQFAGDVNTVIYPGGWHAITNLELMGPRRWTRGEDMYVRYQVAAEEQTICRGIKVLGYKMMSDIFQKDGQLKDYPQLPELQSG